MTMSSFCAMPRIGHLDRLKRIVGYLCKFKHYKTRFRVGEPDYTMIQDSTEGWDYTVYKDAKEILPDDAPPPKGNRVTITSYFDANLMHDMLTGKACTGILHLFNGTPIEAFSKKQATVETATYGSEFCAARTCMEQIVELRNYLRYLGVPIHEKTFVFGDNAAMIDSARLPFSKLHKRHHILTYHHVRNIIASGIISLSHLRSSHNPSNIMSKHYSYSSAKQLLGILFNTVGDPFRRIKWDLGK